MDEKIDYHLKNFEVFKIKDFLSILNDIKIKCQKCGKKFSKNYHLRRHMSIHNKEKNYSCDMCNQTFNRKDILSRHIFTHTGKKPYKCEKCEISFSQRGSCNRHVKKCNSIYKNSS